MKSVKDKTLEETIFDIDEEEIILIINNINTDDLTNRQLRLFIKFRPEFIDIIQGVRQLRRDEKLKQLGI